MSQTVRARDVVVESMIRRKEFVFTASTSKASLLARNTIVVNLPKNTSLVLSLIPDGSLVQTLAPASVPLLSFQNTSNKMDEWLTLKELGLSMKLFDKNCKLPHSTWCGS